MQETLWRIRDPGLDLSDTLCGLITDIRCILIHPDWPNCRKLKAVAELVDELAPPPPPGGGS